ncbi:MAG: aldo/keto reductase [Clostridiales Family XIII bacterium]|nr:aldo/keto reductase [Clostridiales Family XIII bacterium]
MNYRTFGKTGEKISLLGFGAMRLPVIGRDQTQIDVDETSAMIRRAIDAGVNYVDTAYVYHGGNSEVAVGKALKDGYREKVLLADKYPVWLTDSKEKVSELLDEQLKRLDTDVIDMYLIHDLSYSKWDIVKKYDVISIFEEKVREGKIKHIGFSFHDELPLFKEIIDYYDWDFCQIQLNYMDVAFQAGVEGLKYAAAKGIPVIVMEPLKGGKLTDTIPESVEKLWREAPVKRSPAEWAFRWVADFPEVMTILSGMSDMRQVEENLDILSRVDANALSDDEKGLIEAVSAEYNRLIRHSCTSCRYCMPCPNEIEIPYVIGCRNEWELYNHNKKIKSQFKFFYPGKNFPSSCIKCGVCEEKCPQHLAVMQAMDEAAAIFE